MSEQDKVVYRYTPANEGDSYRSFGIPVRDLTEADVAKLRGDALAALAAEGRKDKPMYSRVEEKKPVTVASTNDEKR